MAEAITLKLSLAKDKICWGLWFWISKVRKAIYMIKQMFGKRKFVEPRRSNRAQSGL